MSEQEKAERAVVHPILCQDGCGALLGTRSDVRADNPKIKNHGYYCVDCWARRGPREAAQVAAMRENGDLPPLDAPVIP